MNSKNLGRSFWSLNITQFLGVFNDNAFKILISLLAIKIVKSEIEASRLVALAGAAFIIPFLLFSVYAGCLADRFSKTNVIISAKAAEIIVMTFGFFALLYGNIYMVIGCLFLMGVQSAFFGPAKYGILPEMLDEEHLSMGNGLINMFTFIAIILGMVGGTYLSGYLEGKIYIASSVLIVIAFAGFISSFFVRKIKPSGKSVSFKINFVSEIFQNLRTINRNSKALFYCLIGGAYFWFLGGIYWSNIPVYGKFLSGLSQGEIGFMLIVLAMGTGFGSLISGLLGKDRIELGLIPLGAIIMSVSSLLLGFSYNSFYYTLGLFFSLGTGAGVFVVPISAFIQHRSPREKKGLIIAIGNFLSNFAILLGIGFFWLLTERFNCNPARISIVAGVLTILGTAYVCRLIPEFLIRLFIFLVTHSLYKVKIIGKENIPYDGPALLVCNHTSFVDAPLLIASTSRFIHFIMHDNFRKIPVFGYLAGLMKVIFISERMGHKRMGQTFSQAREYLKDGKVVCIFPEGQITRTGSLLKFRGGYRKIAEGLNVPIIPVYIDRIWGSIFSYEKGRFLKKFPRRIPYLVTVSFGKHLFNPTPFELRQAVSLLASESFHYRYKKNENLITELLSESKKRWFSPAMADSTGLKLSFGKMFALSMGMAAFLKREFKEDKMIGVMLPSSVVAGVVNIAALMTGKPVVNLNFTLSAESLEKAVKKCGIKKVITSEKFIKIRDPGLKTPYFYVENFFKKISKVKLLTRYIVLTILSTALIKKSMRLKKKIKIDDTAAVIFSSGSTGDPKGIMLSHKNIISNVEAMSQLFYVEKKDVILGVLPFFHSFGFTVTLWYPLLNGVLAVYHSNPLEISGIKKLSRKYNITGFMAPPTFLNSYLRKLKKEDFSNLKFVMTGAEKLRTELARRFEEKFGVKPLEGYGATELSPVASVNVPGFTAPLKQLGEKEGTIGRPVPGVTFKIINQETGKELAPGENGLIIVKGPNVMKGYLDDVERTAEVIKDGWYFTGDIGSMDEDGFVEITDRASRFSKIGGEVVPHIKVEEAINEIVGGSEKRCIVSAVSDERKGERLVVLHVDIDKPPEEVIEEMKKGEFPNLWIPKADNFYKVEKFPILGTGKLDLRAIKKLAVERSRNTP